MIDHILKPRGIHLITGSPGSGKIPLLRWILNSWTKSEPVLNYTSNLCPWTFFSLTKPALGYEFNRDYDLAIPPLNLSFPPGSQNGHYTINNMAKSVTSIFENVEDHAEKWQDLPELLIIDGMDTIFSAGQSINKDSDVRDVFTTLREKTHNEGKTALLIGTTSKYVEKHGKAPREKISGFTGMAEFLDTVILITDPSKTSRHSDKRLVQIDVRDEILELEFTYNRAEQELTPTKLPQSRMSLETAITLIQVGDTFTTSELDLWAQSADVSRSSTYTWVGTLIDAKQVMRVKNGVYRKLK